MSDYIHAKTENVQKLLDNCLKNQKQELISKFQTDLDSLSPEIPYSYKPLRKLKEKWEKEEK